MPKPPDPSSSLAGGPWRSPARVPALHSPPQPGRRADTPPAALRPPRGPPPHSTAPHPRIADGGYRGKTGRSQRTRRQRCCRLRRTRRKSWRTRMKMRRARSPVSMELPPRPVARSPRGSGSVYRALLFRVQGGRCFPATINRLDAGGHRDGARRLERRQARELQGSSLATHFRLSLLPSRPHALGLFSFLLPGATGAALQPTG